MKRNDFENYQANYRLSKDWVFPYSQVPSGSKIIVYGAGDVGQAYVYQLSQNRFCEICKWVDRKYTVYESCGLNVYSPDSIGKDDEFDFIVIAVADYQMAREINDSIIKKGISQENVIWNGTSRFHYQTNVVEKRLIWPTEICFEKAQLTNKNLLDYDYEKLLNESLEGLVIPRLVLELSTVCTLKCKNCNNLMQEYRKPKHLELTRVIGDLKCLLNGVDRIVVLELIGGEPFVYPDLLGVLEEILPEDKILSVEITTNATIIPKQSVLDLLKNDKVKVRVSKYKNSYKIDELTTTLEINDINYEVMDELLWYDSGDVNKRNKSELMIRNSFWLCSASYLCKTLYKGKIFHCPRAASLFDLNISDECVSYVDIYETDDIASDIKSFWLETIDEACDHCDFTDEWRVVEAGEQ